MDLCEIFRVRARCFRIAGVDVGWVTGGASKIRQSLRVGFLSFDDHAPACVWEVVLGLEGSVWSVHRGCDGNVLARSRSSDKPVQELD